MIGQSLSRLVPLLAKNVGTLPHHSEQIKFISDLAWPAAARLNTIVVISSVCLGVRHSAIVPLSELCVSYQSFRFPPKAVPHTQTRLLIYELFPFGAMWL